MATLLERIADRECRVVDCHEARTDGSQCCPAHLRDLFGRRLDRNPDGTFSPRRMFVPRDETWRAA